MLFKHCSEMGIIFVGLNITRYRNRPKVGCRIGMGVAQALCLHSCREQCHSKFLSDRGLVRCISCAVMRGLWSGSAKELRFVALKAEMVYTIHNARYWAHGNSMSRPQLDQP